MVFQIPCHPGFVRKKLRQEVIEPAEILSVRTPSLRNPQG
jgi:hypothetical protein